MTWSSQEKGTFICITFKEMQDELDVCTLFPTEDTYFETDLFKNCWNPAKLIPETTLSDL